MLRLKTMLLLMAVPVITAAVCWGENLKPGATRAHTFFIDGSMKFPC